MVAARSSNATAVAAATWAHSLSAHDGDILAWLLDGLGDRHLDAIEGRTRQRRRS